MLKPRIVDLMNEQIVLEIHSAHLYYAMSSWFDEQGLEGYAHWYYIQGKEELDHAMILFNYLETVGERPLIGTIEGPDHEFADVKDILEKTYEHEQFITKSINEIYDAAMEENDYASKPVLDWFVAEQIEEEDNTSSNLDRYELFGKDPQGLHALDKEMGTRVRSKAQYLIELESE